VKHPGRTVNIHVDTRLCGNGRLMRDCCLFARFDTTPPGPATGHARPSCYARDLKDCSLKISREHYISQSVFTLFGEGGITVSGMPWIPDGGHKRVSTASLTGNLPCERHNQALSALDAIAAKYFRFFIAKWSDDEIEVFLTRGYDLERWMLKVLCGLVVSGNSTHVGERLSTWIPPWEWLEILLGNSDVEAPAGLHCIVGKYTAPSSSLYVVTLFKPTTALPIGLIFFVEGIGFLFAMKQYTPISKPSATGTLTYFRPMALQLNNSGRSREAHFG